MRMTEKFEKYAWDQTKKSITIYVPYEGADSLSPDDIQCTFGERSMELRVHATANSCRELKIPNLCVLPASPQTVPVVVQNRCKCIDAGKSKMSIKSDRIQLKLMKRDHEEWSALNDEVDQKKSQRAERMELLADMYANATDEERASLRSAAAAGAKKREENRR